MAARVWHSRWITSTLQNTARKVVHIGRDRDVAYCLHIRLGQSCVQWYLSQEEGHSSSTFANLLLDFLLIVWGTIANVDLWYHAGVNHMTMCDIITWSNTFYLACTVNLLRLLVFSKYFRAGFYTFSRLKFKVNKGTNSCNLCFKIKTKTYLVFISMVMIHSACHC